MVTGKVHKKTAARGRAAVCGSKLHLCLCQTQREGPGADVCIRVIIDKEGCGLKHEISLLQYRIPTIMKN